MCEWVDATMNEAPNAEHHRTHTHTLTRCLCFLFIYLHTYFAERTAISQYVLLSSVSFALHLADFHSNLKSILIHFALNYNEIIGKQWNEEVERWRENIQKCKNHVEEYCHRSYQTVCRCLLCAHWC